MSFFHVSPPPTIMGWFRWDASPRGASLPEFGKIPERLVRGGALLNAGALTAFLVLRRFELLDLDTITLLPAAALAGAAAMSLGVALACLRALRSVGGAAM